VPAAPTEAAILFDLVVGASSIYAGSWMEGGGAVFAENEALRYICRPRRVLPEAGGVFVSGGTGGNLSRPHRGPSTLARRGPAAGSTACAA
jgi:L-2,4-diaminobutyrate decarboxylase